MENKEVSDSVRRMEKGSHEFVVENYSLRRKGIGVNNPIESDRFVMADHRWAIRFYPDGKEVKAYDAGYASLYISLKSDTAHPVRFLCELFILDQSGKSKHHGLSAFEGEKLYTEVHSLTSGKMCGNLSFIKLSLLESPNYLKDDCLRIRATVGVLTNQKQRLPKIVPESNLGTDFGKLLESKQSADVFFKVGDESFCAHKLILAARSPALLPSLQDGHQPQDVVIPDMEPQIFKAVLWFIYTGTLLTKEEEGVSDPCPFILESFLAKMLAAADRFELKGLKEICESRIAKKVSTESVGYMLDLADVCHAAEQESACLGFAAENKAAIMEANGCEYLKETCPLLFLELAGLKDNPSTRREGVLNLCHKVLSTCKESLVGGHWPWGVIGYTKQKIKEV